MLLHHSNPFLLKKIKNNCSLYTKKKNRKASKKKSLKINPFQYYLSTFFDQDLRLLLQFEFCKWYYKNNKIESSPYKMRKKVMKKHILLFLIVINILIITSASSCPYEFSPDDERPFFEQYEIETNVSTTQKKEKKS